MIDEQETTAQEPNEHAATESESASSSPPGAEQAGGASQAARDAGAWDDVAGALEELGQAVTAWTRALRDDPETRRHARELKDGFERLGRQMGDTLDSASDTELGRSVGQAAGRAGAAMTDAARKAGDQAVPFVIGALRGAAEGIRRAADGLENRAGSRADDEATEGETSDTAPQTPPPPVPEPPTPESPDVPEPPAPSS